MTTRTDAGASVATEQRGLPTGSTGTAVGPVKKSKRPYVVVEPRGDTLAVVGRATAYDQDDACWQVVEKDDELRRRAEWHGDNPDAHADEWDEPSGPGPVPRLAAVAASAWPEHFEEYVLEPATDRKRTKR